MEKDRAAQLEGLFEEDRKVKKWLDATVDDHKLKLRGPCYTPGDCKWECQMLFPGNVIKPGKQKENRGLATTASRRRHRAATSWTTYSHGEENGVELYEISEWRFKMDTTSILHSGICCPSGLALAGRHTLHPQSHCPSMLSSTNLTSF
jgi:hypothetical protein